MALPQPGIFALGTRSHHYLALDLERGVDARRLVEVLASMPDSRVTTAGVNLVVGISPTCWHAVAPHELPGGAGPFEPIAGPDGFTMPATQHDAWIWASGSGRDDVFDAARAVARAIAGVATVADEQLAFAYRDSRDLTGFIDGTENPPLDEAADAAIVPDGQPGAGGSVVLVMTWHHDLDAFHAQPVADQEATFGRTKDQSVELDDDVKPPTAHIARVVIEDDGEELEIFRRSTSIGDVRQHGLEFVAFTSDPSKTDRMLRRMVGADDGVRDQLTRFSTPVAGAYYVVPSVEALRAFAAPDPD